jgi:hypothetical protein
MPSEREDVKGDPGRGDTWRRGAALRGQKLTGLQWVFRSRRTGRVSIVSWPNVPLWMWIATAVARRLPFVDGRADAALVLAGSVALVVWAIGELWRGVNPWRRLLGFAVLLGTIVSAVR